MEVYGLPSEIELKNGLRIQRDTFEEIRRHLKKIGNQEDEELKEAIRLIDVNLKRIYETLQD